ncbi:MAG: ABC transporter substrate-binding protein [Myxococcales bacterium]|nr:ABC transporter substrate-binding protein [Myxococcales bacterium]
MTPKTRTVVVHLALTLGLLATLTSCACKSENGGGDGGGSKPAIEKGEDGKPIKVLNYFRSAAHKSLDPPKQFDSASAELIDNVYDTLLDYHYLKRPYELVPNLVSEMPSLSEDGLTYTFKLRKGIKFADDDCFPEGKGRELNADDVIYSIKRFADANINTNSYHVLLKDRVAGMDDFRAKTKEAGKGADYGTLDIDGVKKVDSHTLTITLKRKDPLALYAFASSPTAIVPKEAVEKYGDEFERHPVGTGPFVLAELSRRGEVVLKKNPNYHLTYPTEGDAGDKEAGLLEHAGKQLPLVDEVHLPLIEEPQPRMLEFLKGRIDWIGLDRDNFTKMATKDDKGNFTLNAEYANKFDMYAELRLVNTYYSLNMKDELLGKNKALRQALAYAFNTPLYIEQMLNGRGQKLHSIVPIPIAGSERDTKAQWYEHNLEMAKKKLEEAGFPNGEGLPELTIEYGSSSTVARQNFEFQRNLLAKAGIKVKGGFQSFTAFLGKVETGNFQIASSAWAADYPDGENFYQLLYGPNKVPGPNQASYDNPEFNTLYEQAKYMPPGPERNAVFAKMAEMIKEDVPVILSVNPLAFGMYQKWVGNMKRSMMDDAPYKYLDIDIDAKKKGVPE